MALTKARILVAQMARVYLAPIGTVAPADATAAMPVGWKEVGFFTPDSLQWSTDPSFEEIRSHQSRFPTRRIQTEDAATLQVDLQEFSGANMKAVYGGGTVTLISGSTNPPQYKFSPPQIGGRTSVAAVVEIVDGDIALRRVIPACEQTEGAEQTWESGAESTLPLRLSVIGSDIGDPWYDLTNSPAFADAVAV